MLTLSKNLLLLALTVTVPQLAHAINLPAYPVTANQDPFSATQSLLVITLNGVGTGYDVADAVPYLGWCAEQEDTSYAFGNTSVTLYSSLDSATPTQGNLALPGGMANPNWPKVNYVLNHKQGTANDIQYVIWFYVNGGTVNGLPATAATAAMIADANANGGSFYPGPGQTIAVILYQDGRGGFSQDTLIEVKLPQSNGAVGDYVWMDTNKNGIQEAGEVGLNGVKVKLYDSNNVLVGTKTTANNPTTGAPGWYYFDQLPFGSYKAVVDSTTLPAGITPTNSFQGNSTALDSNGSPAYGTINSSNPIDITLDFGYIAPNWCGLTWGFWKNHLSVWPVQTLTMGGKSYSNQELITILGTAVKGDDSVNLAHQLIAAKLNYAMGVFAGSGNLITTADALLAAYPGKVPLKVKNSSLVTASANVEKYNLDGVLQPGCTMRY